YRNVWGLLREFGDAELALLVAPRGLVIEHSEVPKVDGPPPVTKGRRGGAAVGKLETSSWASVAAELTRFKKMLPADFPRAHAVMDGEKSVPFGSTAALRLLAVELGAKEVKEDSPTALT